MNRRPLRTTRRVLRQIQGFGEGPTRFFAYLSLLLLAILLGLCAGNAARPTLPGLVIPVTGLALVGAILLNSRRLARARDRLSRAGLQERHLFWGAYVLLLLLAVAVRALMTSAIRLPLVMPDSYAYVLAALLNPSFPIGDARPVVFPYLIAGSLFLFRQPIGILIVHNALAILSIALFVAALRLRVGMGLTALGVLVYLLFAEKNLDFEYLLLTEHVSRVIYLLFLAAALFYWKSDAALAQIVPGLLVVLGILTKSSAIVLIPVYFLWRLTDPNVRRSAARLIRASGVFVATVAILLCGYVLAGKTVLGFFPLSSMTGHALYYHVNPLTVFDSGKYPEIKAELREFFPLYREKYWRHGQNLGEWAIWGYPESAEVVRDFGGRSPARTVFEFVTRHPSGPPFPQMDHIFRELSLEAIQAHPAEYLGLSLESLWKLVVDGPSFNYKSTPFGDSAAFVQREANLKKWFAAAKTEWPGDSLPSRSPSDRAAEVFAVLVKISPILRVWFLAIACVSPIFFVILLSKRTRDPVIPERMRILAVLFGLVASYLLLLSFVCPGEPSRYVFNIQDVIVLIPVFLLSAAIDSLQALDGDPSEG